MRFEVKQPNVKLSDEQLAKVRNGQMSLGEAVGFSKSDLYAFAQIGYQLLDRGQFQQAKRIYKGLVAADPLNSTFHCHLAAIHHRVGELADALEHYTKAIQLNPTNGDALVGRGELHMRSGRLLDSLQDLKTAIEHDPKHKLVSTYRALTIVASLNKFN